MSFIIEEKKVILHDREYFSYVRPIAEGSHSYIYRFRIGKDMYALKLYKNCFEKTDLEKIEHKLDINIDSYISPKKILYIRNEYSGYLMKFCKGKDLEKRKLDITIDEFAKSIVKLMEDTNELSALNYNIYDSFISNVMYDEGFKMVDMDDYFYVPKDKIKNIEKVNDIRLNQMLCEIFIKNADLGRLYFNNVAFKKFVKKCEDGEISFDELFNILCIEAFNKTDIELQKISELGKVLSKSKKI